ncbi:MAG: nicotinate-nucleotide--dimethylbenzimidazole phosphoribosyltransferase [Thermodesulfobacteriota bacterium]
MTIKETLDAIGPVDNALLGAAQKRLDNLTKPRGSLGRLEELARRAVAISGSTQPAVTRKIIFTFAGDHGVAAEGVSAFPKEVTTQMVLNFLRGGAGINVLADHAGCEVKVVDIGVEFEFDGEAAGELIKRKVINGTANIRTGPAMTPEETRRSVEVGIELACEYAAPGAVFGTGEMGIANTTPASAMAAVFSGLPVREVTGRGTGIDDKVFDHKVKVIEEAIEFNSPDPTDPMSVLAKVGGAEIAGITGLVLGAAARRVPVMVDGFISTAGALVAAELKPEVKDYLFASHNSVERGHAVMLERMGLKPLLDLEMRLGEGTGAAMGIYLLEAGVRIYNEMATFGDAGVSESDR